MRKENFFNRYPQRSKEDAERKWKIYQEEQEMLRLMEQQFQMIQQENAQFFATGSVGIGGRGLNGPSIVLTYSDLDNTPVNFDDLALWNSHFDLPANGPEFTGIKIEGNEIILFGQPGISLRNNIFSPNKTGDQYLTSIVDNGLVTGSIGNQCFALSQNLVEVILPYATSIGLWSFDNCENLSIMNFDSVVTVSTGGLAELYGASSINLPSCTSLGEYSLSWGNQTSVYLPLVQTVGAWTFNQCQYLLEVDLPQCTSIGNSAFNNSGIVNLSIPLCITLGDTTGDDGVFYGITDRTMTLIVNPDLLTASIAGADGDIVWLTDPAQNNTVTIN